MSKLRELKRQILEKGVDGRIDDADWALLKQHLPATGKIDPDDMQVLVELRVEAHSVCPAFDKFFFPAFKAHLLADGRISFMEEFHLLRILYGGGGVDDAEKQFLRDLLREVPDPTPEFEAMCKIALEA